MFKFEGHLDLRTSRFLILLYCISCHIGVNVSFKFGGVDKHSVYLFVCFICCLVCFCLYIFVFFSVYNFFFVCCYAVDCAQLTS
jgi:hypothetical protein